MARTLTWMAAAAVLTMATACLAQQTTQPANAQPTPQTLPLPAGASAVGYQQSGHGLRIGVYSQWLDSPGYRPFRIVITPTAPVVADRTLTVQIVLQRWMARRLESRIDRTIEIPAGSGPVETVISVPQSGWWNACSVSVSEEGIALTKLSSQGLGGSQSTFWNLAGAEQLPRLLIVADALPDTTKLADSMTEAAAVMVEMAQRRGGYSNTPQTPIVNTPLPTAMAVVPGDLPDKWIDYTCLDIVCLSIDELAALAKSRPAAFRAILDWTAVGGNLWVYGIETDKERWQRLPELMGLLGLPVDRKIDPAKQGWRQPDKSDFGRESVRSRNDTRFGGGAQPVVVEDDPRAAKKDLPKPPDAPHFVLHNYRLGQVVALAPKKPFPGTRWDWGWVLAATHPGRWTWTERHGLSAIDSNPDFWNFLIPGVGLAPVTEFRILITLFVLAIGPVNYYFLRRWKRLHLLVLTIPLSAAVVTGALFAYAIVSDGLAVRVRARSITHLDQRQGHADSWSRLSYYAGLAPSRGLIFAEDTAVLPLSADPSTESPWGTGEMYWDDQQHLVHGWLASRTPTQYLALRSRPSQRQLVIDDSRKLADELKVENHLDTAIDQLAIQTADGKYYWVANVQPDATVWAKRTETAEVLPWLRNRLAEQPLEFPPGMDRQYNDGVFGFRATGRYYYAYGGNRSSAPTQTASLLEKTLSGVAPVGGIGEPVLRPGTYVAFVQRSPEIDFGTEPVREEASLHVILGEW